VYIVGDPEMFSFKFNTYHFNGENGRHGGSKLLQHTYIYILLDCTQPSTSSDDTFIDHRSRNDGTWW
jgi:hypothetical protein